MDGIGFEFGRNDCALFCARYLVEVHGYEDFAVDFRGKYATEEEAFDLIRDEGGLLGLCRKHLGEPKPILQAKRGDILYRTFPDGTEGLGVCDGRKVVSPTNGMKGHIVSTHLDGWECAFDV